MTNFSYLSAMKANVITCNYVERNYETSLLKYGTKMGNLRVLRCNFGSNYPTNKGLGM